MHASPAEKSRNFLWSSLVLNRCVVLVCFCTVAGLVSAQSDTTPADHLALSADGRTAAATYLSSVGRGAKEHTQTLLVIYEMTHGAPIRKLVPSGDSVVRLAISPDGNYVVVITRTFPKLTESAQLFGVLTGRETKKWENYNVGGQWCAFTIDAKSLIVAGANTRVVEWSLIQAQERDAFTGFHASVNAVAVSRDNKFVIAGGDDTKARIWDRNTTKELAVLTGHSGRVLSVAFSADATLAITGSADKHAKIWGWAQNAEVPKVDIATDSAVYAVSVSTDKTYAAVGSQQSIQLASVFDGAQIWSKRTRDRVDDAAFSEDGKYLTIYSGFTFIHRIPAGDRLSPARKAQFWAAQFSADGHELLYSSEKGEFLLDVAANKPMLALYPDDPVAIRAH